MTLITTDPNASRESKIMGANVFPALLFFNILLSLGNSLHGKNSSNIVFKVYVTSSSTVIKKVQEIPNMQHVAVKFSTLLCI